MPFGRLRHTLRYGLGILWPYSDGTRCFGSPPPHFVRSIMAKLEFYGMSNFQPHSLLENEDHTFSNLQHAKNYSASRKSGKWWGWIWNWWFGVNW